MKIPPLYSLVWGSLRLAPIKESPVCITRRGLAHARPDYLQQYKRPAPVIAVVLQSYLAEAAVDPTIHPQQ